MRAEIIGVGTELLLGEIANSNAAYVSRRLAELGIDVYFHTVVGDNASRLGAAIDIARDRADVLIFTGGLGPTDDDLTRETVAARLGIPLVLHEDILERIRQRFACRGMEMTKANAKQAMVPRGALVLENQKGTAPGLIVEKDSKSFILLPGPPWEMKPMFDEQVVPYLEALLRRRGEAGRKLYTRTLRVCGIGESSVEASIRDVIDQLATHPLGLTIAPYAKGGEVHLRLAVKAEDEAKAEEEFSPVEAAIRSRLGMAVYGRDETTLEEACGRQLAASGHTLAVAESCTGGMLSSRIVNVPGSSAYFRGGIVAYSNDIKEKLLYVEGDLIRRHGAVSAEVAEAMARGARAAFESDWALGVTGVAGPGGGSAEKPVGTVFMAVVGPSGRCRHHKDLFWGSRHDIRHRTTQQALTLLWQELQRAAAGNESGGS